MENIRNIGLIGLLVLSVSCSPEDEKLPDDPQEFVRVVLEYELTYNERGLNNVLCKSCQKEPFKIVSYIHKRKKERWSKMGANINDDQAHDFSKIDCREVSTSGSLITYKCEGQYVGVNEQKKIIERLQINKRIILKQEGSYCTSPPVCNK